MNPSSVGSVPTPPQVVKPQAATSPKPRQLDTKPVIIDRIHTCVECWLDTDAVLSLFGREVCPDCYRQAEEEHDQRQAAEWDALDFGRHDQMSSMKDVLIGMGF